MLVALGNSAKIHAIFNIDNQGENLMLPVACKAAYTALLSAKVSGRSIRLTMKIMVNPATPFQTGLGYQARIL